MASDLRVLPVMCITLYLFSSICAVWGQQDGANLRNDPAPRSRQLVRDDVPPGGRFAARGAGDRVGAGGGVAVGANGGQPQYYQQQKQQQADPKMNIAHAQQQYRKPDQQLNQNRQPNVPLPDQPRIQQPLQKQSPFAPKPYNQQPPPQQWQGAAKGIQKPGLNRPMRISESPACREDVATLCGKNALRNNFNVLECLQNAGERDQRAGNKDGGDLSDVCNRFLWDYKFNLTKDVRFDSAAFEVCKADLKKFPDCAAIEKGQGFLLPCLYEVAENITTVQCRQYIKRMKAITFSDYRLINGFFDQCRNDIDKTGCGIVNQKEQKDNTLPHKQGATINCLQNKVEVLEPGCKKQILRVAELTAEDYHTDRAVYFACRDDRERFCEGETAGQGAIYNCLLKHKFKEDMSENCRNKLTTRQKVASVDYKANYRLVRKCKEDMKRTKCTKLRDSKGRELRLSQLLICLEDSKHNGVKLSGDCVAELEETRKSLMEDFMVNPEVITQCKSEIAQECSGLQRGGKTLHCLMKLAQGNTKGPKKLGADCDAALMKLVKTADAGANYHIDKALHKACKTVRDKICKDVEVGDAKVLSCLMENIYSSEMTKECEKELLLLQYFIARDFKLDPLLFKNCKMDVEMFCGIDDMENSKLPQGLVFSCLHRNLHSDSGQMLQPGCQAQVHRLLRQRAISVHLNPQIEAFCRSDLGQFCTEKTGKGQELSCLQEHMKELSVDCKDKIGGFTQEEAEDIKMNRKLMAACAPMIKQFCKDFLSKKVDEGAALQCLIDHKNDDEMNEKCQAGIEHFQLIQLQDYRFNFKFKEACRKDVIGFCKTSKDKSSIVKCLSSKVRDDTLLDHQQNVSEECRKQLKAELLQRSEDIKLDPELYKGCEVEVQELCNNLKAGKARILECLRDHRKDLGETCHLKLFNRVKEQAQNVKTDYAFMHACQKMIKQFCTEIPQDSLFKCLKSHKNEATFDPNCKTVLTKRSIQKKEDFRLNPRMQKACRRDMPKFCSEVLEKSKTEFKEHELEGLMMQCLKGKFSTKQLSPDCENYVKDSIQEASMDIRMDPFLFRVCKDTVRKLCSEEMESPGQGLVEECLKSKLHQGKIQEIKCRMQVIRLLQEGRADVHVDPLLYKSCALDIKHFCAGIPQGQGRQMSCLLEALDDNTIKLHSDCRRMMSERKEMWSYAVKEAPPGSLSDLAAMLNASAARGYFLTILLVFIGLLFFGGLCCGRATKRVRAELKNK